MSTAPADPAQEPMSPEPLAPEVAAVPEVTAVPEVAPVRQVPLLNIANILTVSRLVLVPVFLFALFAGEGHSFGWRLTATVVFAVASVTDQLDGWLARRHGLVTDFGKVADPIADKALTGAALFGLSILGELPWWVTIVVAAREIGVTLLRFWVIRYGVIPASRGGKLKTLTQIVAIGFYLAPLPAAFDTVQWIIMLAAVALTAVTGLDYVVRALRLRAQGIRVRRAA
ncbi:CDP-diacylglycerol--glycerol-3-phosphate 3-phosphatidyltransferase [Actinosynnema sp. ALI-1.44]|uniref:CDP-diacylglycerol--glycerol-3-phosphate 3-phosphatidyltransferase n=1 Tax=Actinosynnema sp. ALI-1.44 TaxID=1933779 RepID=UPI00097BA828|nr:CDP-diacylglycerol--glycerol-3-phosphate 3-phosphatidyltransferase [Actinosynnema sp. ALI-1.44]ONI70541.1 CDP-diacylglycerol--glycerol-3-phosphate 3-phosphatidyltransferase [Actinosynnema sp. ALI-1.44]